MKRTIAAAAAGLAAAASTLVGLSSTLGAPAAEAAPSGCVSYQYSYGGSGSCVGDIQRMLNQAPYLGSTCSSPKATESSTAIAVDNAFGAATQAKVKNFQAAHCLTPDGIVGPKTWQNLCFDIDFLRQMTTVPDHWGSYSAAVNAGCATVY